MNTFIDEIAKDFLSEDNLRPAMTKFHRDGDNIIATNAHTLIVSPARYFKQEVTPVDNYPDYKSVIPEYDKVLFSVSVNDVINNYKEICNVNVYEQIECSECEGEGFLECVLGHEHECKECDGYGYKNGKYLKKEADYNHYQFSIGGTFFNPNYVHNIAKVCKFSNCEMIDFYVFRNTNACLVKAGEIVMLIMPMSKDINIGEVINITVHEP